jgi:hypothetical protein
VRAIPLLPCASIDEISKFTDHLGFRVTYRQVRPNPYVALGPRRPGAALLRHPGLPAGGLLWQLRGDALARDTTARPEERREAEEYLAELRERLGDQGSVYFTR